MTAAEKKQLVLDILRQQSDGINLPQLLTHLGENYTERTLRRWLSELSKAGLVVKKGQKRATRYFFAETSIGNTKLSASLPVPFSETNMHIVSQIRQPLLARPPISYQKKWLDDYIPNQTSYLSYQIRQHMAEFGMRQIKSAPAGTYAHKIYTRLLIDLSYNSSRLEGNTYSLLDTQKLLLSNQVNQEKLSEEAIMIMNHKEAIKYMVDKTASVPIDFSIISTLHYLLSDSLVPTEYSGKIRDHGVRVSASAYIPIDGVERLTKQLTSICHKAELIDDPYEKSFFLLVHIAYLQAFTDVNKRTSRLAANIPLNKANLVPLSFNDIDKDDYLSAMIAIYELNNVNPLAELYAYSYLRTCQQYDVTVEAVDIDEVRARYREPRRAMIRDIIQNLRHGKALKTYMNKAIQAQIPDIDRIAFQEDLLEDLRELSPQRIAGLGITEAELFLWLEQAKSAPLRTNSS